MRTETTKTSTSTKTDDTTLARIIQGQRVVSCYEEDDWNVMILESGYKVHFSAAVVVAPGLGN